MARASQAKHFLDSSVARPLLTGSQLYKAYFATELKNGPYYVNGFVLMEIKRSYILSLIEFYFVLEMSTIKTVDDAFRLWSNQFKNGRMKAVLQVAQAMFQTGNISSESSSGKEAALTHLGHFIRRQCVLLKCTFRDVGADATKCARAKVELNTDSRNMSNSLREFFDAFMDVKVCRSQCNIDTFFLKKYERDARRYSDISKQLEEKQDTRGFLKIAKGLEKLYASNGDCCTCHFCKRIGDAVIALGAPREMRLEHIDQSFDHLCPPIHQQHKRHLSERALHAQEADQ